MTEVYNPFLTTSYIDEEHFCDRIEESNQLIGNINNGTNTTLFALRRLGKTGLVSHVFHQLTKKKKVACIYIDIYQTQNLKELTNTLANAIYNKFPKNRGIGKQFWEAIKLFRPVVSIDSMSGAPELSLDISTPKQFENTLPQLFTFLEQQNTKIVIAIDEFQQIVEYPEKNIEAILRTIIQNVKNINFIFLGSNFKIIHEMFNSSKRPFYESTSNLPLGKIDVAYYTPFIAKHFKNGKFVIDAKGIEQILELTDGYTYYTQALCNELYKRGNKKLTQEYIQSVFVDILKSNEDVYFQYRNLLTTAQWQLLKAIAKETRVDKPFAKLFISTYHLGSSAMVKRGLTSLEEKEMIYKQTNANGNVYEVYNKFFMRWLQFSK
jgi:uncharacterized protein